MGRMLNQKRKKATSHKQPKEIRPSEIGGFSMGYQHSEHNREIYDNPCAEISMPMPEISEFDAGYQHMVEDPPLAPEPIMSPFGRSIEDILQSVKEGLGRGRCSDLWKDGDW